MLPVQVQLVLPDWVHAAIDPARDYPGDAGKVAVAIDLSRHNIEARTGGPFGAAVFGPDDRLVAAGVNVVLPQHASVAHAEIMAFMLAQQCLQRPRFNELADGSHVGPYTLATSAQPCCQCFGASIWAGIDRLLIGARAEDVEALTEFDEGPLPDDWIGELGSRGIEVVRDLHRDAARAVLAEYGAQGGKRY
ncbi:MAG: nucleoside deaminase [Pseudomonadota bacterium]|nr:nucleoside deaminase [Pseudomonadota bacterium]